MRKFCTKLLRRKCIIFQFDTKYILHKRPFIIEENLLMASTETYILKNERMLDSVAYFAYISHLNSLVNLKALVGKMKIRFYFRSQFGKCNFPDKLEYNAITCQ